MSNVHMVQMLQTSNYIFGALRHDVCKQIKFEFITDKVKKSSKVQMLFSTPNCRKSKLSYSMMTALGSLENPKNLMILMCPFALFKSAASSKQCAFPSYNLSFNFFHYDFFISFSVFTKKNDAKRSTADLFRFFKVLPLESGKVCAFFLAF